MLRRVMSAFEPGLSARSAHLREANLLRAMTLKVNAFDDGINLGQGVCDLDMPRTLRLAAVESLFVDRATYTAYAGIRPLREQICRRTEERYGLRYGVDDIVVATGSSGAFAATLMTLIDPGDEIILFEPYYPYHRSAAILAGATVRAVGLDPATGAIDWAGLQAALGPRTKILLLNTPSNPSGKVWTADEIGRVAELLRGTGTVVVSDEIYEDLLYEGRTHFPPAAHPELYERTVTISGLSKSFSITGWRIGWIAAPPPLSRAIGPVFDTLCVCAARPLQKAAAVALRDLPESYFRDLCAGYEERRELLAEALRGGGFEPLVPAGAYYMLADYRGRYGEDLTPVDACFKLLDEAHLAAIPGTLFWEGAPRPVLRFQFAVPKTRIAEVGRRLRASRG